MAWTQAQLDALDAAIAQGARQVQYADRAITYSSMAEMMDLRQRMADEIAEAAGTPRPRQFRIYTAKGL